MPYCPGFSPKIEECQSIIGYTFKSDALCAQSLNAAADGMVFTGLTGSMKPMPKSDRLAVYGDSAASLYLCNLWFEKGLAKICMEHALDGCINLNGGTTRISPGMAATAVEAILGAVEIDGGRDALATAMDRLGLPKHAFLSSVTLFLSLPCLYMDKFYTTYLIF
ncbi:hypothetical protein IL306_014829 [Fusarium sp. DS 682]|nr:hypothetical protein IL306_014829 [Fusarium sp. DS 682]